MLRCNDCQPLILDLLYGLLDAPEAAAVEAHLAECPGCSAARAEAARLQGLIATAARREFPQVRFGAPASRPPSAPASRPWPATPRATAAPAAPRLAPARFRAGLPWAVAAAILLAIPGTVIPVQSILRRAESARQEADTAAARLDGITARLEAIDREARQLRDAARLRLAAARQAHDALLANWLRDEKAALQTQTARTLTWDVLKPASLQPGAPNELLLVVRDRGATPPGRVLAEVRDQTDAVLFSQPIDYERRQDRDLTVRLPARLWENLTPQSELFLVVSSVDEKTGAKTALQEKVRLFGPVYSTVLTTDKPTYRPGESIHVRSLTLDRTTFAPPTREQLLRFQLHGPGGRTVTGGLVTGGTELVRVTGGSVETVNGPDGRPLRGVGTATLTLPPDAPDGDYRLVLEELPHPAGYPPVMPFPVSRTIKVRSGPVERYQKQIGFSAASYSPGDTVEAWAELRSRGQPVEGVEAVPLAVADEYVLEAVPLGASRTGADGRVRFRFLLPTRLDRADVRLKVTFRTAAGEEAVADRVPVVGQKLIVEFFPEGGDLVGGLESRVYFRATTPAGLPVDVSGVVTDGRRVLAEVQTLTDPAEPGVNRGIGSFTFTPELGLPVWLKLRTPQAAYAPLLLPERGHLPPGPVAVAGGAAVAGSRTGFLLPEPKAQGVVMTVRDPVTAPGQPVRVVLRSKGEERNLLVGAYTRGRLADSKRVKLSGAPGEVVEVRLLANPDPRGGVVRLTVFEEPEAPPGEPKPDLIPVAERLVFRRPGETLNLSYDVAGGRAEEGYPAGQPVELDITATDEKGRPVAAVLYAAVVNSAVAPASRDRRLTTHFLLAGEITTPDTMEHADFLLTSHPKAAAVLDSVLATQGWRRFAEQTRADFARKPAPLDPERLRLQLTNGEYPVRIPSPGLRAEQKVRETYLPRFREAVAALEEARRALARAEAEADPATTGQVQDLKREQQAARDEAQAAADKVDAARRPVERFLATGWYAVSGLVLLAVTLGLASLVGGTGRLPLGIGTAGSLGLAIFLVFALGTAEQTRAAPTADTSRELHSSGQDQPVASRGTRGFNPAQQAAEPNTRPHTPPSASPPSAPPSTPPNHPAASPTNTPTSTDPDGSDNLSVDAGLPATGSQAVAPRSGAADSSGRGPDRSGGPPASSTPPKGPPPSSAPAAPANDHHKYNHLGGSSFPGKTGTPESRPAPSVRPGDDRLPKKPLTVTDTDGGWQPHRDNVRRFVPDDILQPNETSVLRQLQNQKQLMSPEPSALAANAVSTAAPTATPGPGAAPPAAAPVAAPPVPVLSGAAKRQDKRDRESPTADEADEARRQAVLAQQHVEAKNSTLREQIKSTYQRKLKTPESSPKTDRDRVELQATAEALAVDRILAAVPTVTPLVVREYAAPRPGAGAADPSEADTVLWVPVIVLPQDGRTRLSVPLGSAPGGYRVVVAGHTLDGRIGAIDGIVPVAASRSPLSVPPVPSPTTVTPNKP